MRDRRWLALGVVLVLLVVAVLLLAACGQEAVVVQAPAPSPEMDVPVTRVNKLLVRSELQFESTGNLLVGDGTPSTTQDGEDAYVEGTLEVDGAVDLDSTVNLGGDVTLAAGYQIIAENGTNAGVVFAAENTLAYTDVTSKTMFVLPANSDIVDTLWVVSTAFNDSGTDTIDCGTSPQADPDDYVDGYDGSSATVNRLGDGADMPSGVLGDVGSSNVTVVCLYTGQNSNASAGAGRLIIWYSID